METERKLDVLADIARALNQSGVTWAVGGSLLLYFKGKTGVFRDIDLMVCETCLLYTSEVYKRQAHGRRFGVHHADGGLVRDERRDEMCIRDRACCLLPGAAGTGTHREASPNNGGNGKRGRKLALQLSDAFLSLIHIFKGNEIVLEKLLRMDFVKDYPDDTELLEDVIKIGRAHV